MGAALTEDLGHVDHPDPRRFTEAEHHAALAICARARGRADATFLLDACGLYRPGAEVPRLTRASAAGCGYLTTAPGHRFLCQP